MLSLAVFPTRRKSDQSPALLTDSTLITSEAPNVDREATRASRRWQTLAVPRKPVRGLQRGGKTAQEKILRVDALEKKYNLRLNGMFIY